jgi:hypothetical protein
MPRQRDRRAVAQAGMRRDIDAVEQRARLGRIEHRGLSRRDDVPGAVHRVCRVDRYNLAIDQPIEQVPQRREPLLDRGRRQLARRRLDPRRDMHWLDGGDRYAGTRTPREEFFRSSSIGASRMRVADVGREEFEEADRRALTGRGDERGQSGRADRDELVHPQLAKGRSIRRHGFSAFHSVGKSSIGRNPTAS